LVLCLVMDQDFLIGVPLPNCIHEPFKYSTLICWSDQCGSEILFWPSSEIPFRLGTPVQCPWPDIMGKWIVW